MNAKRDIIRCVVFLWLAFVAQVRADDPWAYILAPTVVQSDVETAIDKLSLSQSEEEQLRSRYAAFSEQCSREAAATRAKLDALDAGESGSYEEVQWHWQDVRRRLDSDFENEVMAQMPDEQRRKTWHSAIAAGRRRTMLAEMRANRSVPRACDPIALLDPIELTEAERARIAEAVNALEQEMDDILRNFDSQRVEIGRDMRGLSRARDEGESNPKKLEILRQKFDAAARRGQELVARINSCIHDGTEHIAAGLESPHREQFLEAKNRLDYPDAFRTCPAELALEAIRLAPDIPPEKRAAIEALFADYQPARDQLVREIVTLAQRWEAGEVPQLLEIRRERMANRERLERHEISVDEYGRVDYDLAAKHPINPLLRRRHDLAIETVRKMRSVFTADELQKLPLAARLALDIGE